MKDTKRNSTKYLIIGRKDYISKRGAYVITKRFAESFNNKNIIFKNDTDIQDILEESTYYDRLVFTYQQTNEYSFGFRLKDINSINNKSTIFTRDRLHAQLFNSASNGFSVYNNYKIHKNFIPIITDFEPIGQPDEITIGFYARRHVAPDAIEFFQEELAQLKHKIRVVIIGESNIVFPNNVIYCHHTTDNKDFFSRITHYYMPQSAEFVDPFPNMLLEAVQTGKQIISPKIPSRKHADGIDDILSILNGYHTELSSIHSKNYDNSNHGLTRSNFEVFYTRLLDNGFNNPLEYNRYKTFYDWCSHNI